MGDAAVVVYDDGHAASSGDSVDRLAAEMEREAFAGGAHSSAVPAKAAKRRPSRCGSAPALSPSNASSRAASQGATSSPFRQQLNYVAPRAAKHGGGKFEIYKPEHSQEWDHKFHLEYTKTGDARAPNELVQSGLRKYFSKPQSMPELKAHLNASVSASASDLIRSLDQPEPKHRTSPFSADTAPSKLPERYEHGGTMRDRKGKRRLWNNRWPVDVGIMNKELLASHRQYFDSPSPYDRAESQSWRKYHQQETSPGVWVSTPRGEELAARAAREAAMAAREDGL